MLLAVSWLIILAQCVVLVKAYRSIRYLEVLLNKEWFGK